MTLSPFVHRHIGPNAEEQQEMLNALSCVSLDSLINQAVPEDLRVKSPLNLPEGKDEHEALSELEELLSENVLLTSLIGQGYYDCITPPVIQRNMFENPGWYTSYTPYQPEISQGRLEMLFNFQTLITELTGLPIAGASLLDEATAVAESATLAVRSFKGKRRKILVASELFPQTMSTLKTRLKPLGLPIETGASCDNETAGVIVQWPDARGLANDFRSIVNSAKAAGALVILAADPLALTKLECPGNLGVDIAVGSMQRYGVPMGLGGPHAAYMAVTDKLKRMMPGRIIGQSVDSNGQPAYRLALQTREQHIRRGDATSNICTAQALLANMAAAYAIYHGPEGLRNIADRIHAHAAAFAEAAKANGYELVGEQFFDTVTLKTPDASSLQATAREAGIAIHADNGHVSMAFDETTNDQTVETLAT
ncbi:MAG: glycine dehydrogenase, partial [Alphaproteobacteria bacterium]